MDKRSIIFVIVSSLLVFVYMLFEAQFAPPPNRNADQQVAEQEAEQAAQDAGPKDIADEQEEQEPAADDESATQSTDEGAPDQGAVSENDPDATTGAADEPEVPGAPTRRYASQLLTLGSMAADSPTRMLATLNSRGGTLRRLELNDRESAGQLRYQETDENHGYLGNLELVETATGLGARVRIVGPGTPAAQAVAAESDVSAGLRPGDILLAVNETPIADDQDLERVLTNTRAGQTATLAVLRGDRELTFTAELLNRPLQIISPTEISDFAPTPHPESMRLQVGVLDRGLWRPFPVSMEEAAWETYELTHEVSADTDYYETGPQQGTAADGRLLSGDRVEIVEDAGSYTQVRRDDGVTGWVSSDSLEPLATKIVSFAYWIEDEILKPFERSGPLQVVKRYQLATTPADAEQSRFFPSYHLQFDIELRNFGDEPQAFAFQLDGPTGAPLEGWWYAQKIHGRSTAIGYTAGARDIIGSSQFMPFRFFGGPEIYSNELDRDQKESYQPLAIFPSDREPKYRDVNFLGVDAQYFTIAWLPAPGEEDSFIADAATAIAVHPVEGDSKKVRKKADVTFRVTSESLDVPVYEAASERESYRLSSKLFAGPKEPALLKEYGLQNAVSYGWFAWFSIPLTYLLHAFYYVVGNYGLAIIMLTVLVRAAMIPISRQAVRNAQMMQYLQPEMKRIADKYKDNFEKRGQAQRELFQKYNYNPMGGCLLVFLQLPIFIGLYRGLSVDIALRDQPLIPGLDWCSNLAAPDKLIRWDGIPLDFLFSETGWLGPYFNVLPIITITLFLIQQKLFTPPATNEQMEMTQKMMSYMMIFIGVMFFKVPAGLCIYFITSSLWGIAERKLLPKPKLPAHLPPLDSSEGSSQAKPQAAAPDPNLGKAAQERRDQLKQRRKKKKQR